MNTQPATHPATNHAASAEVRDPPETKQSPQSSMTRMTRMTRMIRMIRMIRMTRSSKPPPTKNVFMFLIYFKRFVNIFFQKN